MKAKCINNRNGIRWNRGLFDCSTCDNLSPLADHPDFDILCDHISRTKGKFHLKRCTFTCKNGNKIQPFNWKKVNKAICSCKVTEDDKKCHWRSRGQDLDVGDQYDFSNWSCDDATTQAPTTTTTIGQNDENDLTTTTDDETEAPIPVVGLKCPATPAMIASGVNALDNESNRIVGGAVVEPNSWPWIVRLSIKIGDGSYLCGGTIVDEETVLTAAHCCKIGRIDKIEVVTGDHSKFIFEDSQKKYEVLPSGIHVHPDYNKQDINNDFCILKPTEPMQLESDPNADFACLPSAGEEIAAGTSCWTAGWGTLSSGGAASTELRAVDLKVFSNEYCDNKLKDEFFPDSMICAGQPEGGKDACQGDSGGPLICAINDRPVLVGVTSWGYGCASKSYPGVWAKVSRWQAWITALSKQPSE